MKIWRPMFLGNHDELIQGNWLIRAEEAHDALKIAKKFLMANPPEVRPSLCPSKDCWQIVDVKAVIFINEVAML